MVNRVVVTGGAGMLGVPLVRRLLSDGCEVVSVDLRAGEDSRPGLRSVVGDIRDGALMARVVKGADAVVHSASALPSYRAEQIRSVVVDGTRAVLTAAREAAIDRVVHVSSTAAYGLPKVVPTPEDHPRVPVDPYSRAKVAAEDVCEEFRAEGMCVPVLRPKTFLGPGRMGLFAMLFEWAEEGRHFPVLGSGDVRTQMLDMDDLIDAVIAAMHVPAASADGAFNLGAAEFTTLREDFQAVLDAAGHGKRVVALPAKPTMLALQALDRTRLSPVYGRLLHKLLADSYVSIDRAREHLGFTPRYSNQDTILRTFAWWREQQARGRHRPATGVTSRDAWRQGALALAKAAF